MVQHNSKLKNKDLQVTWIWKVGRNFSEKKNALHLKLKISQVLADSGRNAAAKDAGNLNLKRGEEFLRKTHYTSG